MANTVNYYLEQIKLENELHDLLIRAANVEVTYNGEVMTLGAALTAVYGSIANVPTTEGGIGDSGKKIGGAALAETPDADTLATEAAVAGAVASLPWIQQTLQNIGCDGIRLSPLTGSGTRLVVGSDERPLSAEDENGNNFWIGYSIHERTYYRTMEDGSYIVDSEGQRIAVNLKDPGLADILSEATYQRPSTVIGLLDDTANALAEQIVRKVDKEEGKGLSSNDFTDADKARLDGLRGVRYGAEPPADMQNGELFIRVVTTAGA